MHRSQASATTTPQIPSHAAPPAPWGGSAALLRAMAAPLRLRIIGALCEGEKNVSELLATIETSQPNLSQHLNLLYRAGVLAKRKEGTQVIYRVQSEKAVTLCRTV
ncbi:MAG: winged helix-turn-helix transcriptional regulator, partial [Burkholderiaceae bacterium]